MNRKRTFQLSTKGIDDLMAWLKEYNEWLKGRGQVLLDRLAMMGATNASLRFARAIYSGINDTEVTAKKLGNSYVISANGAAVLFIEFGSGITYGGGHPEAGQHGMGPGTYPDGKGHWDDPNGWWIPKDKGGGHTYGNPPAMAMYETVKDLESALPALIKEVFA